MKKDKDADPVARDVKPSRKGRKGGYTSTLKMKGIGRTEGGLESAFAYIADIDPRVILCRPQPATFDLNTGKCFRSKKALQEHYAGTGVKPAIYTPDFLVQLRDGTSAFFEVKTEDELEEKPGIKELPRVFEEFGCRLIIVTDALLRGPAYQNAKLIRYAPNGLPPDTVAEEVRKIAIGGADFSELRQLPEVTDQAIVQLVREGLLSTVLTASVIGPQTKLTWCATCHDHLEVLPL